MHWYSWITQIPTLYGITNLQHDPGPQQNGFSIVFSIAHGVSIGIGKISNTPEQKSPSSRPPAFFAKETCCLLVKPLFRSIRVASTDAELKL